MADTLVAAYTDNMIRKEAVVVYLVENNSLLRQDVNEKMLKI